MTDNVVKLSPKDGVVGDGVVLSVSGVMADAAAVTDDMVEVVVIARMKDGGIEAWSTHGRPQLLTTLAVAQYKLTKSLADEI